MLLDPFNKLKLNYNLGDTLKLNIKKKWDIKGFDAVIGNPPYQEISKTTGISKGGGNNLYTKFIYFADTILKINGLLLFITPPTFFSPGRSNNKDNMNLRKDILNNYYYHYINLEECSKHFNVGSKFIYYLIEKQKLDSIVYNNELNIVCKYNKKIYNTILDQKKLINLDYIPYLLTNESLEILSKMKNMKCDNLKIFNSPDNRSDKKHILKKLKNESLKDYEKRAIDNNYIYPMQATGNQIVYSFKECINQSNKKILMSRSGYLKPFYDDGIIGIGGDCFAVLVDSKKEGDYIIKLLNSKLYKFYIEINKWSGFHNKEVLKDLKYIKLDNSFTIDDLYKYFDLTPEEINLVNTIII